MPFKDYSKKQKKLAAVAEPRKKITKADLDSIRKSKGKAMTPPRFTKKAK